MGRFQLSLLCLVICFTANTVCGQNAAPQTVTITMPVPIDRKVADQARVVLGRAIARVPQAEAGTPRVLAGEIVLPRLPVESIVVEGPDSPWEKNGGDDGRVLDRDALAAVIETNAGPALVDPAHFVTAHEVILELDKEVSTQPEVEAALFVRAALYSTVQRYDLALADLDGLVAGHPRRFDYLLFRAYIYQRLQNVEAAKRDLDRAAEVQPKSPYVRADRYKFFAQQREFEKALQELDVCVQVDPQCHEALTCRANLHRKLDQLDKALDDCNAALRLAPKSASALTVRGNVHHFLDRLDEAIADFDAAIAASTAPSADRFMMRAAALYSAKRYEEALRDAAEAMRLEGESGPALMLRSEIKRHRNDKAGALVDLLKAALATDTTLQQKVYVADRLVDCDERSAATKVYAEAAKLPARSFEDLVARARARAEINKTELAIEDCSAALLMKPTDTYVRHLRAFLYAELREWPKAQADVAKLIDQNPHSAEYLYLRGRCAYALKQTDLALADFSKAIELDPKNTDIRMTRASVRHDLGQYSKAIDDYAAVIQVDPNCASAYRALVQIWSTCPNKDYRQGEAAVGAASRLVALPNPEAVDFVLLAAAHAQAGNFAEAIKHQEEALRRKPDDQAFQTAAKAHLQLYRSGKAYNESDR